ncbi:MAG: hypothetical protein MZV64_73230 [Ignavibacteriales bacterium]|nr:hypothetical protein [Ignavibacteriales bacterium]
MVRARRSDGRAGDRHRLQRQRRQPQLPRPARRDACADAGLPRLPVRLPGLRRERGVPVRGRACCATRAPCMRRSVRRAGRRSGPDHPDGGVARHGRRRARSRPRWPRSRWCSARRSRRWRTSPPTTTGTCPSGACSGIASIPSRASAR